MKNLNKQQKDDIIFEYPSGSGAIPIRQTDIDKLISKQWINDSIINLKLAKSAEEFSDCAPYNTFFIPHLIKYGVEESKKWHRESLKKSYTHLEFIIGDDKHWRTLLVYFQSNEKSWIIQSKK